MLLPLLYGIVLQVIALCFYLCFAQHHKDPVQIEREGGDGAFKLNAVAYYGILLTIKMIYENKTTQTTRTSVNIQWLHSSTKLRKSFLGYGAAEQFLC